MNQEAAHADIGMEHKQPINWWLVLFEVIVIFLSALVVCVGLNIEVPCLR